MKNNVIVDDFDDYYALIFSLNQFIFLFFHYINYLLFVQQNIVDKIHPIMKFIAKKSILM